MKKIKRKIEFFWMNISAQELARHFSAINNLSCKLQDQENRFMKIGLGDLYISLRFNNNDNKSFEMPIKGSICYTRTNNLPFEDIDGVERPLSLDEDANGLLEKAHFIVEEYDVSGQHGVLLLLEKSKLAPSFVLFYKYLKDVCHLNKLVIYKLFESNILEQARLSQSCSVIDLEVLPMSDSAIIEKKYGCLSDIFSACRETGAKKQRFIFKTGSPKEGLSEGILTNVVDAVKDLGPEMIARAQARFVSEFNPDNKIIDLLSGRYDRIVYANTMETNEKYLDSDSMYSKMIELYTHELPVLKKLNALRMGV